MSSADAETCAVFSRGNSHSIRLPVFESDLPTEMNAQEGLENETLYQLDSCPLQRILVLLFSSSLEFLSPSRHLSYFPHCHAKPNAFPLIRRPSLFERTEVRGAMAEPWDYEEMLANKERRDSQCSPSCGICLCRTGGADEDTSEPRRPHRRNYKLAALQDTVTRRKRHAAAL